MEAAVPAAESKMAGDPPPRQNKPMLYMVYERFKEGAAPQIYRRLRERGRMMPEGLEYVSSWIDLEFKTCYQVMQTADPALFRPWTEAWSDLMDFEIVAVRPSAEARALIESQP